MLLRVRLRRSLLYVGAVGLLLLPSAVPAQEARARMTLEQIEQLLGVQVTTTRILETARQACISFRVDSAVQQRLRAAGGDDALITGLRELEQRCLTDEPGRVSPPPPAQLYNPGSAFVRSLIIPGLGQFYTNRAGLGVVFLAAWGGALGYGLLSEETTIECLARVTDICPAGSVRGEITERPALPIGVGAAIAIAIISGIEANSGAKRANQRAGLGGDGGANPSALIPTFGVDRDGSLVTAWRIRF